LRVNPAEFASAEKALSRADRAALKTAYANLRKFHLAQRTTPVRVETTPGIVCEKVTRPIERVGLYVPGGSAPLFSTALMLGVPSQIAGNAVRVLCTPPGRDGKVSAWILCAAQLCGITDVFKLGGAQAIAAMAYGTATIPKCDKLFGPGNSFVTEAKLQVSRDTAAIDLPAGPSEVMVVADNAANPAFVAADLLSQAEHGPDSQVIPSLSRSRSPRALKPTSANSSARSRAAQSPTKRSPKAAASSPPHRPRPWISPTNTRPNTLSCR
jgi:histidinol dehydrogenase